MDPKKAGTTIERVAEDKNKKRYFPLLLLADEQEKMIDAYLARGEMFILRRDGRIVAACVATDEGGGVLELKNLAVEPDCRRRGYGRMLVEYLFSHYAGKFDVMIVGTGESPLIVPFYEQCGFRRSKRVKDFFITYYDHPIVEAGVRLTDMVYFSREFCPRRDERAEGPGVKE